MQPLTHTYIRGNWVIVEGGGDVHTGVNSYLIEIEAQ